MKSCLSFSLALFTLFVSFSHAEIYKWTDADGNVIYGDKPQSSRAIKIKIRKRPPEDMKYRQRIEKQQKLLNVMQDEREDKLAQQKKEAAQKAKQQEQCKKLIAELKEMKNASFLYEESGDPFNPKVLSDEKRKQEEKKYQKYIYENC